MADELLKKIEPRKITLADGKEYKLSPINLNILARLEEEFGCQIDELGKKFDKPLASTIRVLLYVLLKDNHPEMTKEKAGSLVSMELLSKVSEILSQTFVDSKGV